MHDVPITAESNRVEEPAGLLDCATDATRASQPTDPPMTDAAATVERHTDEPEPFERELDAATEEERILLLNRRAADEHRANPQRALRYAKRALEMAARFKDRLAQGESYRIIGLCNLYLARYGVALLYLRRGARLCEEAADVAGQGRIWTNIGTVEVHIGEFLQAMEALYRGLELARSAGDRGTEQIALANLGVLYSSLGDFSKSLDYYYQSLAIKEELGAPVASDLNNIGGIYCTLENWEKALQFFTRCLEIHRANGDQHGEATVLSNIGSVYAMMGERATGYGYWTDSLAIFEALDDIGGMSTALGALGTYHRHQGEYEKALEYYTRVEEIAIATASRPIQFEVDLERGYIYRCMGDRERAIAAFQDALAIAGELGSRDEERLAHRELASLYEELGDAHRTLHHFKLSVEIREEMMSQEKQNALAEMQTRWEVAAAEKEREILRLKAERLELDMDHKSKELTSLAMQLVQKNEFLDRIRTGIKELRDNGGSPKRFDALLREIESNMNAEGEWEVFDQQFRNIHQDFTDRLARAYPMLTPTELKVCALLKIDLSTKEIANLLCSSPRTVEDHRYKIRTKMGLDGNLAAFLKSL